MKVPKPLAGVVLAVLALWAVAVAASLGGVGVDSQLIGSDWQLAGLGSLLFFALAFGSYAILGEPGHSLSTPYW